MRRLVVVCSLLVASLAATPTDVNKTPTGTAPTTSVKTEVDTFHCVPNSNVAVIKSKTLPIYVCRLGDLTFILAAEGHAQAHLDLTLDHEAVKSLSEVYVKREGQRPTKREKRQFGGGGFGGGFSGSSANAGSFSSGGGFGHSPFGGSPLGGGFGGGFSNAGAQAGSSTGSFGFGR